MDNNRVILIKGNNSKWYEQAIFIVRKDASKSQLPVDFVSEAEKIINNYMRGGKESKTEPSKTRKTVVRNTPFDYVLNTMIVVCFIALAGILTYAFFA